MLQQILENTNELLRRMHNLHSLQQILGNTNEILRRMPNLHEGRRNGPAPAGGGNGNVGNPLGGGGADGNA